MKLFVLTIILFLAASHLTYSQTLSRKYLNSKNKEYNTSTDKNNYIINEIHYLPNDYLLLDKELKKINQALLTSYVILKGQNTIVIEYATPLKKDYIQTKLIESKNLFNDIYYGTASTSIYTNSKDPVLYINNKKVAHYQTKQVIENLQAVDLGYIKIDTKEQNFEYYGQNAKNGIVIIWTTKELNKYHQ